jgi:hypothetical protein
MESNIFTGSKNQHMVIFGGTSIQILPNIAD